MGDHARGVPRLTARGERVLGSIPRDDGLSFIHSDDQEGTMYDPTISEVAIRFGVTPEQVRQHAVAPFLGHSMLREGRVLAGMLLPLYRRLHDSGVIA